MGYRLSVEEAATFSNEELIAIIDLAARQGFGWNGLADPALRAREGEITVSREDAVRMCVTLAQVLEGGAVLTEEEADLVHHEARRVFCAASHRGTSLVRISRTPPWKRGDDAKPGPGVTDARRARRPSRIRAAPAGDSPHVRPPIPLAPPRPRGLSP